MRFANMTLPAIVLVAAPAFAMPPQLTVAVPAHVIDGEAIVATVTLRAPDGERFRGTQPRVVDSLSVHLLPVTALSERCVITRHYSVDVPKNGRAIDLAPGKATSVDVDLLADYPIGLSPGQYDVVAEYRLPQRETVRSVAVRLEIVAPTGGNEAERYREFVSAVGAVCGRDREAGEAALAFGRKYPEFRFTPGLLSRAALVTGATKLRNEIDDFVAATYPNSEASDFARRDSEYLSRREQAIRADEEHRAQVAAELRRPENKEAAAAFAQVGSIINVEGWRRHEDFLARFPNCSFAPDVLYDMIAAALSGVLPPGKSAAERDNVVRELRARLLANYPHSFRAEQMRSTPSVQ